MSEKRKRDLPDGWEEKWSKSNQKTYYWNTVTNKPQWEVPTEPAAAQAKKKQRSSGGGGGGGGGGEHAGKQVRACHILVKHKDSRRPYSSADKARTGNEDKITRTKEEAIELLKGYAMRVEEGEMFSAIAKAHSDCSSFRKGGDLGRFTFEKMQRPFSKAAFALKVGQVSGVVDTDSGVHIILRTE